MVRRRPGPRKNRHGLWPRFCSAALRTTHHGARDRGHGQLLRRESLLHLELLLWHGSGASERRAACVERRLAPQLGGIRAPLQRSSGNCGDGQHDTSL